MNQRDPSFYKAGDKVQILRIILSTNERTWPGNKRFADDKDYLKVGDFVILNDPPTYSIYDLHESTREHLKLYTKEKFYLRTKREDGSPGWIPLEWVVACGDGAKPCNCDITVLMVQGCICGHLKKEATL